MTIFDTVTLCLLVAALAYALWELLRGAWPADDDKPISPPMGDRPWQPGDLTTYSDEEILEYARGVTGTDRLPRLNTVPYAMRRLAAMVDELRAEMRGLMPSE